MDNQNQINQNETSKYSNTETSKAEPINPKLTDEEELKRRQRMLKEMKSIPIYY